MSLTTKCNSVFFSLFIYLVTTRAIITAKTNQYFTINWTEIDDNPLINGANDGMAIAVYNNTVTLIGGYQYGSQVSEFNLMNKKWTNVRVKDLDYMFGTGQFYHQQQNILYMIDASTIGFNLSTYNLSTKTYLTDYPPVLLIPNVNDGACLTGINGLYLVIIGGYLDAIDIYIGYRTVHILFLNNFTWYHDGIAPFLNEARYSLSCIFNPYSSTIYAIGGNTGTVGLNSIETLYINETFVARKWVTLQQTLPYDIWGSRAVNYKKSILVIGGFAHGVGYYNGVELIDVTTGNVSLISSMPYGISYTSPVIVNDTLYCFGGRIRRMDNNSISNEWIYGVIINNESISTSYSKIKKFV